MKKARDIVAEFMPKNLSNHGVLALSPDNACAMIACASENDVAVLGIDAFVINGVGIQPFMEHSVDYSTRGYFAASDWDEATTFIRAKAHLGLSFEVVLGDKVGAST